MTFSLISHLHNFAWRTFSCYAWWPAPCFASCPSWCYAWCSAWCPPWYPAWCSSRCSVSCSSWCSVWCTPRCKVRYFWCVQSNFRIANVIKLPQGLCRKVPNTVVTCRQHRWKNILAQQFKEVCGSMIKGIWKQLSCGAKSLANRNFRFFQPVGSSTFQHYRRPQFCT